MPSATPIYDALAEEMLGPLTDLVPQWLIGGRTESLRPPCEARISGLRTPWEVHRLDHPQRTSSSPPARHRLI